MIFLIIAVQHSISSHHLPGFVHRSKVIPSYQVPGLVRCRLCNQGQSTRYHCRLDTKNSNSATRKSFKKIAPHLVQVLKGILTNLSVYYLAIKAYLELFMTLWMWVWYPLKWGSNAVQNGNEIPTRLKIVGLLSTPGANNNLIASHRAMTRNWSRL